MRLANVVTDNRSLKEKAIQGLIKATLRDMPDVLRVQMHRPALFGGVFGESVEQTLHKESEWSVGERETFAATLSRAHDCPFCATSHTAFANAALKKEGAGYASDAVDQAPQRVRAACDLVRAIAQDGPLEPAIAALREAGASDAAIEDVIDISASFTMINRIANTLDFDIRDPTWKRATPFLARVGYRTPGWKFRQ